MSRRSERLAKRKNRSGLYALLACGVVVVGALLFGLSMLSTSSPTPDIAGADPVESTVEATTEETTRAAEETSRERTSEEQTVEKEAQRERTTEAQTAEAPVEEEPVEEVPVAEEPVTEEPVVEGAGGGVDLASVPAPASPELYLTVPKMGLSQDYVANGVDEATLTNGAGHVPETGFPWQEGANTYIASHVLGYEGTGSYLHFAELPNVTYGDEIFIADANGTEYRYEVYEILQVSIYETWVMEPVGGDVVSLQTCINPPDYDVRLVVRGKLVETNVAA
ncbi:sortase [Rubrobacter indicoceani]|uniref:sortase n=1 Tax=Rubrobacter indicoceani TaxID=2051957 RepID=UPI000E5AAAE2|nr:class E sortase [Rubrobacter indicoceani]